MSATAYAAIRVGGSDAFAFLQGQLSNDLRRLANEPRILAAWCNPKGRVICLLRVGRERDDHLLALPAELADDVVRRLTLFRFRAKVSFAIEAAPRLLLDGSAQAAFDLAAWQLHNLRSGIPEIGALQCERFTPHMLNLDCLDAVSFDKGCYTGQEIVARTRYRGASRRRLLRLQAARPVADGAEIRAGELKAGEVVNAIGTELLAVVSLDLARKDLQVGDVPLEPAPLPYTLLGA